MSRPSDNILSKEQGFHNSSNATMVNPIRAGQMGYATALKYIHSSTPYVPRPLIFIVVKTPTVFDSFPDPEVWHATGKALWETLPKMIDGAKATVSHDYVDTPAGGAGELMHAPSKSKRERSDPSMTLVELAGKPINAFLDGYIRYGIQDPEAGIPLVSTITEDGPTDLLSDTTGFTVMAIEPDPTGRLVQMAYLWTNLMPQSAGEVSNSRDITTGGQIREYNIQWTCFQQVGAGVNDYAQTLLDELRLSGADPSRREAMFTEIDANVQRGEGGYREGIAELADSQVSMS